MVAHPERPKAALINRRRRRREQRDRHHPSPRGGWGKMAPRPNFSVLPWCSPSRAKPGCEASSRTACVRVRWNRTNLDSRWSSRERDRGPQRDVAQ